MPETVSAPASLSGWSRVQRGARAETAGRADTQGPGEESPAWESGAAPSGRVRAEWWESPSSGGALEWGVKGSRESSGCGQE